MIPALFSAEECVLYQDTLGQDTLSQDTLSHVRFSSRILQLGWGAVQVKGHVA